MGSAHYAAAKHTSALLVQKTAKELASAIGKAVHAYAIHEQASLEYDLHKESAASQFKSREQTPDDEKADVLHFVTVVGEFGMSPNMLGRLKNYQAAFISRLIILANQDRKYAQADNEWPLLLKHGFLNAHHGELTEDEARALTQVAAAHSDPEVLSLQERFETRFGHLDLTPGFMASCQRLLDNAAELTDSEAEAIFDASGLSRSLQALYVQKVLGLSLDETAKVDVFVKVMEDATWQSADSQEDLNRRLIVNALLLHFNDFDAQGIHPSEWLRSLTKSLLAEGGFIARHVSSEAAFWSLYFAALELSTFRNREEVRFLKQRKDADQATRDALTDYYRRNAMTHHHDEDGIPWLGTDRDQQVNDDLDEPGSDGSPISGERPRGARLHEDITEVEFAPCDLESPSDRTSSVGNPWSDESAGAKSSAGRQSRFEEFE